MENIVNYFSGLEPKMIDQTEGEFLPGEACCVGAHLASLIGKSEFTFGKNALAVGLREAGHNSANAAHVHLLLRAAGIADPWSWDDWKRPPAEIFAEMAKIEKLPATRRADFEGADLSYAKLSRADFEGADFRGADLRGADFFEANFAGALYDAETKFPAGFCPEEAGMIKK